MNLWTNYSINGKLSGRQKSLGVATKTKVPVSAENRNGSPTQ